MSRASAISTFSVRFPNKRLTLGLGCMPSVKATDASGRGGSL